MLDKYLVSKLTEDDLPTLVCIIEILGDWCKGVAVYLDVHGCDTGAEEGKRIEELVSQAMDKQRARQANPNPARPSG